MTRPDLSALPVLHENLPVLEVAEALTLDHLLTDPTIADAVVLRPDSQVAVLDPAKVDAVVERLVKLGHLPKVL